MQPFSVPVENDQWRQIDGIGLAGMLAELALAAQRPPRDGLRSVAAMTEVAAAAIPGTDCAAVVIMAGAGKLEARAVHGDLPPAVMDLQNETGQGPCLDAIAEAGQIQVSDAANEQRWPLFSSRAAATGALSMISTPLPTGTGDRGSLSLVSRTARAFGPASANLATIFAAHTAVALAGRTMQQQLSSALATRDAIGQAKGILMERYKMTPDAAFALLTRVSQHTNTKLRDVADGLCQTGGLPELGNSQPPTAPRR